MSNTGSNLYSQGFGTTSSVSFPGNAVVFTRDPTTSDISNGTGLYTIGQLWVNDSNNSSWQLTGFTSSNGIVQGSWTILGGSGTLSTLSDTSNVKATPSGGNIQIAGSGSINTVASGSTITVSLTGGGSPVTELTGNTGGPITPTAGNINVVGAGPLAFAGSGSTLTGTITPGTALLSQLTGDTGTALPTAGSIQIASGVGISTSASGSVITIAATGGGEAWQDKAVSFTAAANTGYFITAASVVATLPTAPANGSDVSFAVTAAATFTIQAAAGQTIVIGGSSSAVAGTASSTLKGDSIELVYHAADTAWYALSAPEGAWSTS